MACELIHTNPDVYVIRIPFVGDGLTEINCFVFKSGDESLVIDTGANTEEGRECLRAGLDEIGLGKKNAVFLTHLHYDHSGLVGQVLNGDDPLYVSRVDDDLYRRGAGVDLITTEAYEAFQKEGLSEEEIEAFTREVFSPTLAEFTQYNTVPVGEGDKICVGDYTLEVMETAGHTPGHISLYERTSRIFFSGDLILFSISPFVTTFPDDVDGFQIYIDNLGRVQDLAPLSLLYAHGSLKDNYRPRIEWLFRHHDQRLEEMKRIVEEDPEIRGIDIIKRTTWRGRHYTWEERPVMQRWSIVHEGTAMLRHLVRIAALATNEDDNGVRRYMVI